MFLPHFLCFYYIISRYLNWCNLPQNGKGHPSGCPFSFSCKLNGRTIEMATAISRFCAGTNYHTHSLQRKTRVQIPSPAPKKIPKSKDLGYFFGMKRTLRCMKHEVALRAMKRACGTLRRPRALRFTRAKASASYWRSQCFTAAKPLLHFIKPTALFRVPQGGICSPKTAFGEDLN